MYDNAFEGKLQCFADRVPLRRVFLLVQVEVICVLDSEKEFFNLRHSPVDVAQQNDEVSKLVPAFSASRDSLRSIDHDL